MPYLTAQAYAKVNLTLDILRKRPDGYHDMCMIMQTVSLCDRISLRTHTGQRDVIESNLPFLPKDEKNLALHAAREFFRLAGMDPCGISMVLEKTIPVCAGLGGGSADAAAVLNMLDAAYPGSLLPEELYACAAQLGSDVPFCMAGGTMLASGRGEKLQKLPDMPPAYVVLCKPPFPLSTRSVFSGFDCSAITLHPDTDGAVKAIEQGDVMALARRMYNVFEPGVAQKHSQIGHIKSVLLEAGALGAVMSGSGPTVFGLFSEEGAAAQAYGALRQQYAETFLAQTCHPEKTQ